MDQWRYHWLCHNTKKYSGQWCFACFWCKQIDLYLLYSDSLPGSNSQYHRTGCVEWVQWWNVGEPIGAESSRPHSDRKLLHVLKSIERLSDTEYQLQRQVSLVTLDFQFSIRCRDRFNGILQGCLSWAKTLFLTKTCPAIWKCEQSHVMAGGQGFTCSFFLKLKRGEAAYRQLDRNNFSSPQIHEDRSFSKGWLGHLRLFGKGSPNKPCRTRLHLLREVMSWVFWDVILNVYPTWLDVTSSRLDRSVHTEKWESLMTSVMMFFGYIPSTYQIAI